LYSPTLISVIGCTTRGPLLQAPAKQLAVDAAGALDHGRAAVRDRVGEIVAAVIAMNTHGGVISWREQV
jgi:hypothetical protein